MFNLDPFIITYHEPPWQAEEDAIVGKMLRQLLSFEGQLLIKETLRSMESIIESAAMMAEQIGARGDYVRSIGQRVSLNGSPMSEVKHEVEHACPECGNYTYGTRYGRRHDH